MLLLVIARSQLSSEHALGYWNPEIAIALERCPVSWIRYGVVVFLAGAVCILAEWPVDYSFGLAAYAATKVVTWMFTGRVGIAGFGSFHGIIRTDEVLAALSCSGIGGAGTASAGEKNQGLLLR